MRDYPRQLEILINELSKLPGVGEKSAQRLAFHILDKDEKQVEALADSMLNAKRQLKHCSVCGNLTDEDWTNLIEGAGIVGNSRLIIDDTPGISVTELRSRCRKYKLEHHLDIIMIDYLQLIQ